MQNLGILEAASGGMIGLAGSSVSNQGTIEAHLGSVVLASGDAITLDFDGQDLIHFTVSEQSIGDENLHAIDNRGHIRAPGGSIHLQAKAAPSLINQVVNNEGFIEANQVHEKGGVIYLTAQGATIKQQGVIEAQGGHISFKSDQSIHFEDQSSTRVDHAHQAGHIVGEAHHIRMDDGSSITANSANQGGVFYSRQKVYFLKVDASKPMVISTQALLLFTVTAHSLLRVVWMPTAFKVRRASST